MILIIRRRDFARVKNREHMYMYMYTCMQREKQGKGVFHIEHQTTTVL